MIRTEGLPQPEFPSLKAQRQGAVGNHALLRSSDRTLYPKKKWRSSTTNPTFHGKDGSVIGFSQINK